jgi:hypothetical protein
VAHTDDTPAGGIPIAIETTTPQAPAQPADAALNQHMQRLTVKVPVAGDPTARFRLAAILHRLGGWDVFADDAEAERAYVSRLWAEDWDSPEDAVYDEE